MDLVMPLMQTLQANANLEHTEAVTQDTRALAQMRQFNMMQTLQAQQATAKAMQDIVRQEAAQSSGFTPGPPGTGPESGPLSGIYDQLTRLNKQASTFDTLAKAVAPYNPKQAESYGEASAKIRETIAARNISALDEQAKLNDRVGGYLGAVKVGDQEGLNYAIQQVLQSNPRALSGIQMDVGQNGMPLPTARTIQNLQTAAQGSLKRSDQLLDAHRIATEQQTAAIEARRAQDFQESQQNRRDIADQNVAVRREGLEQTAANRADINQRQQVAIAERVATHYTADSKDFIDKVKFVKSATGYLFDQDGKMRDTSAFTAAGDKALSEAYIKTVFPDYKGSVYDKKGLDNLTGLPGRFVQGLSNLAYGKELPKEVRVDMFNAMQNQFKNDNVQQIEREDNYRTRLANSKVDPALIDAYLQPYALRPTAAKAADQAPAATGGASPDVQMGRGGVKYEYIGGPGGDRTLKSNWRPVGGGS